MERINLKADNIAAYMAATLVAQHRLKTNGLYVEIEVKIDGHVVGFTRLLAAAQGAVDAMVRAKAIELLDSDEGLATLRKELLQARLRVSAAVNALPMPPAPADPDELTPV
jgi:hypothetical protein